MAKQNVKDVRSDRWWVEYKLGIFIPIYPGFFSVKWTREKEKRGEREKPRNKKRKKTKTKTDQEIYEFIYI